MTTIDKVWDPGLRRYRDPHPRELSPALRACLAAADQRARGARTRQHRTQERTR